MQATIPGTAYITPVSLRENIVMACGHCQHDGPDVGDFQEYAGGRGYVWARRCVDSVACWARWDRAHGLA